MQITTTFSAAVVLIATAAAQSTATSAAAATSTTDLPGLISQLPKCALPCLESSSKEVGCDASDLKCLCSKASSLVHSIGPCVVLSGACSPGDRDRASSVAQHICSNVKSSNSTNLASASNVITSALGTSTASASSASASGNSAAGVAPFAGMGVFAAALALVF